MGAGDYRIAATWAALKADSSPLLAEPHPTQFNEGTVVGESETGYPIELGDASTLWEYENQILSTVAWEQLRSFVDGSGQGIVYVQTRTNVITDGEFTYSRFRGYMQRPVGATTPPWRFRDVTVEFFSLEAWSDVLEAAL